jgi:hypothetical protein
MLKLDNPSQAPVETKEAAAARLAAAVTASSRANYQQLCQIQKRGIDSIWNHPTLTPQEACNALGTGAKDLFIAHGILTSAIVNIAALAGVLPDIKPPTFAFTINPDGTVTVSDLPYSP